MKTYTNARALGKEIRQQRAAGKRIALVPTMGNLHAGHLHLVETALEQADFVVTTIFVNPLQFGPQEDLATYPRTLADDQTALDSAGCHAVFHPSVEEIYGTNLEQQTTIHVPGVSENYCGATRPGHFDGVATVVCKLLNLTSPDVAYFGLKDYQQFLVIRKMVTDLGISVEVKGVEIVRANSGLALSSRNGYLNAEQKLTAAAIHECLSATALKIREGNRDYRALEASALEFLAAQGLRPDYFAVAQADSLQPAAADDTHLVILAAAFLGPTRLIDNVRLVLTGSHGEGSRSEPVLS